MFQRETVLLAGLVTVVCFQTVAAQVNPWETRAGSECQPGMNKRDGVENVVRGCGTDEKTRLICVDADGNGYTGKWEIEKDNPDYLPCEGPGMYCKEGELKYDPGSPESSRVMRYPSRYQDSSCVEGVRVKGWDAEPHGWECEWWMQEHPVPEAFQSYDAGVAESNICDPAGQHLWTCLYRLEGKPRTWGKLKRCSEGCREVLQDRSTDSTLYWGAPYNECKETHPEHVEET